MPRPSRLVMLVAAVAVATGCSSGASAPGGASATPTFSVSGVEVQSVVEPAPSFPNDVRTEVLATLDAYLDKAMVVPLRTGQQASDLDPLFTAAAASRVDGPDRSAMVDDGLPRASDVRAVASTAQLGALVGPGGDIVVVTATIDLRLQTTGGDPLTVARTGDLVLVPEGGSWKIDGYDLSTTRDSGAGPATTAARR